ncbi:Protein SHQ1 homolog, partial [Geodia barretti]
MLQRLLALLHHLCFFLSLQVFRGRVEEVIYCSARRCLCYPLYRHWQLVQCVLHDTTQLFLLGRRKLLQCLLDIRRILNSSEPYYVMNNLYITDYCVWIQRASSRHIQNLALELKQVKMEKSSMGWELAELEQAARLVAAERDDEASTCESGDSASDEGGTESSSSGETDSDSEGETERNTMTKSTPGAANPAIESTSDAARNTRESLPRATKHIKAQSLPSLNYNTSMMKAEGTNSTVYKEQPKDQNPTTEDRTAQHLSPLVPNHTSSAIKAESQGPASTLCKEQNPDTEDQTVSPLNNNTSTTEHSRDRVVEELSEGLCTFLTIHQPPSPQCPPTTSLAGRNLIEE